MKYFLPCLLCVALHVIPCVAQTPVNPSPPDATLDDLPRVIEDVQQESKKLGAAITALQVEIKTIQPVLKTVQKDLMEVRTDIDAVHVQMSVVHEDIKNVQRSWSDVMFSFKVMATIVALCMILLLYVLIEGRKRLHSASAAIRKSQKSLRGARDTVS